MAPGVMSSAAPTQSDPDSDPGADGRLHSACIHGRSGALSATRGHARCFAPEFDLYFQVRRRAATLRAPASAAATSLYSTCIFRRSAAARAWGLSLAARRATLGVKPGDRGAQSSYEARMP